MGEPVGGVAFELDAFLEVHEVELDLLRAAPQREVGDDDVEEGGFARAGFAGDQAVLAGAFADGEVLELGRAGAADGHAQLAWWCPRSRSPLPAARRGRKAPRRGWNPGCSGRPGGRTQWRTPAAAARRARRSVPGMGLPAGEELVAFVR